MEGAEPLGVLIPVHDDPTRRPGWSNCESGWVKESFGIYGIPFRAEGDLSNDGVWALSGRDTVLKRFTKEELRRMLSHKVLVDGSAAEALAELGMADLIGVRAVREGATFHCEEMDEISLKLTPSDEVPVLKPLDGAKTLSWLVRKDSATNARERVAPGATAFRNALGGHVVATSWHSGVSRYARRSEQRQLWVGRFLEELDASFAVRSADPQDTLALAARAKDGAMLVQLVNLCYDPLEKVSLKVSGTIKTAEYMDNHGSWRPLDFTAADGILRLSLRLEMMEERIIRLTE